jgi:glucose/arabinose dehydrogenase
MSQEQNSNRFDAMNIMVHKNTKRIFITSAILFIVVALIAIIIVVVQPGRFIFGSTFRTIETSGSLADSFTIEPVITGLDVPWSIAFITDDTFFFTERTGRVRLFNKGTLQDTPALTLPAKALGEAGLLGMALHPDFPSKRYAYIAYTYQTNGILMLKIERYSITEDLTLTSPTVLIDNIPAAQFHAGCRIAFGPDKKLYITTGDAGDRDTAQSLASYAGKTLRINDDGSIPDDNPFVNTTGALKEIWSYGHRNAQGMDWDAKGMMYQSEHGPSGFDGGFGNDEVNLITKGSNYGWPIQIGNKPSRDMIMPVKIYENAIAPGGLTVPKSDILPQLKDKILVSGLRGATIVALNIENGTVISQELVVDDSFGRIREVTTSPSGYVFFSTSNRDGRGNPKSSDDTIYRIVPKK